ncbi:MFS general substrate transporter [Auriscalpium vulgare]|uniref:MFS general substrate transporter n=1 Tax=Auriscalpium vulgare TaxID=40419 RepID=A0ACB8S027_9AGAM|nr:MFS general substrate transporter [Auriscalpium vulgare]
MSSPPTDVTEKAVDLADDKSTYVRPVLGKWRRLSLLFLWCLAEFMDSFVASAIFPAIPAQERALGISPTEITWVFSAYGATFSAFLLISGRISDIYSAKWSFIVGSAGVGLFALGCGFVHDKIALFILRALTGVCAALTVPSALSLIVEWFPDPQEQNRAIAAFGGTGALGNVLGIVIGGVFVQWASWRWDYWFTCMMGLPIAIISILITPQSAPRPHKPSWRRLDLGGVVLITAAIILFIYGITTGSSSGWKDAKVIAPLILSVLLATAYFILEAKLDPHMASLPPSVWKHPNVPILVTIALVPFFFWCALYFQLIPRFQEVYGWSAILTAIHFLPTGIFAGLIAGFAGMFPKYVNPKWTILFGLCVDIVATILLPFANKSDRYWSLIFPAFIIGTMGNMIVYTNANIAIFMNTPPELAGTIGAIFNAALQMGNALGLAVIGTITNSVDKKRIKEGEDPGYHGIADGFWFLLAALVLEIVLLLIFYKIEKQPVPAPAQDIEGNATPGVRSSTGTIAEDPVKEASQSEKV